MADEVVVIEDAEPEAIPPEIPEDQHETYQDLLSAMEEKFGQQELDDETDISVDFAATDTQAEVIDETPEPVEEGEQEPAPVSTPDFGGLTQDQVDAYQQFDTILKSNPQLSQLVTGVLSGQISLEQAQEIAAQAQVQPDPTPPPDLDLDDPNIKYIYEQNQRQAELIQELRGQVSTHTDYLNIQRREVNESMITRARNSFQQQHGLNDDELSKIETIAGGLEILPALAKGFNPATGQWERPDALAAVERAFEVAYWSQPEYRQREYQRQQEQSKIDNKRKQKLAAVSGNSGSVPRTQPTPQTQEGRRQAMIAEVAASMSGNVASGD